MSSIWVLTQEAQGHCCRAGKAGGKMLMLMVPVLLWCVKSMRKGVAITKQKNG